MNFFANNISTILVCHPSQAYLHCNARCRNFDIDDNGRTPAWRWMYYAQVDIVEIVRHAGIVRREGGHWELTWRASVRSVQSTPNSVPTDSVTLNPRCWPAACDTHLRLRLRHLDLILPTSPIDCRIFKVWDCRLCWFCQYCHCCLKLNPILSLTKSEL